jgi:hypothetical protein
MFPIRVLILAAAIVACGPSQSAPAPSHLPDPNPTPHLCSFVCSSNTECRSPVTLCRFCNFGRCSQTLPQLTVRRLEWIQERVRVLPDATGDDGADALNLLRDLVTQAQRTADDAAALDASH